MRILFSKTGAAKYMSHLDLMRCMTRTLVRADVPVWYTQGFNPHPYLVFSPPLPLGISSRCEMLDIKLDKEISTDRAVLLLNECSPEGLIFEKIYEPKTSFNDIAYAKYAVKFENRFAEKLAGFLDGEITVEKKTKSGIKTVNVKSELSDLSLAFEDNLEVLSVTLPCGNDKNVGINLLTDAFAAFAQDDIYFITERLAFLDKTKKTLL